MAGLDNLELALIFGLDSKGETPEERARSSQKLFVRSQDQIAEYSPASTGRRLSAWEAYKAYGLPVLQEIASYGSAILPANPDEPAATLADRRKQIGYTESELAQRAGLSISDIKNAEDPMTRNPIRVLEKIAQELALDGHKISFAPKAGGDDRLGYRLRDLRNTGEPASTELISRLCEAAWVIMKQYQLREWLFPLKEFIGFTPSANYGAPGYPAWRHGYYLAQETRKTLSIPFNQPISNLRTLVEDELGIPVVQLRLPKGFAGATIANGNDRGIALNIVGENRSEWVRRITLAHELGHLLWDPDENLTSLQLDRYDDLEEAPWQQTQYVEQRANAFAVEFIAPQEEALKIFKAHENYNAGLRAVMETFGLSYTSAKYHIWNASDRSVELGQLTVDDTTPTDDWKGRESFSIDYFKPESTPDSRRGEQFAGFVFHANASNLISLETAADYLGCTIDEYVANLDFLREFFSY
ncbi:ImmA/IrrE family metallo-endopeptidase [Desulfatibacillum aliphaticivorans]|uniref:ImmA/IrrE family metallo-endopeptidase n=1 Tax=Desulfatibacillum aliphaticivorans TaxID=218208 RepID=UPI0003F89FCD|nr:ImmA/IrrE family metallo-endopeptidase [Desulfatibacillum aliphaticivorans]